jgi:hypothetical protein
VVTGFVSADNLKGYTGGTIAMERLSLAGQAKKNVLQIEGCKGVL